MSKKSRKRRKAARKSVPDLPTHVFAPLAKELDWLIEFHRAKWPDGVSPTKCIHPGVRDIGPVSRAFNAGVRARSLYDTMKQIRNILWVPEL